MFDGVVGLDGGLYLNKIEGAMDNANYNKLLKKEVMSLLHSKFGHLIVFQKDNARPLTVLKWNKNNFKVASS